jgi:hypothetical protein
VDSDGVVRSWDFTSGRELFATPGKGVPTPLSPPFLMPPALVEGEAVKREPLGIFVCFSLAPYGGREWHFCLYNLAGSVCGEATFKLSIMGLMGLMGR